MIFSEMFHQNYSYFLNKINYNVVTVGNINDKVDILISDDISFEMLDLSRLKVVVGRQIAFNPNVVYELHVSFGAVLTLKDGVELSKDIDLEKEFISDSNGAMIIQGLLSRVSMQIAQITSSYGQNPIVTPPNLIKR